MKNNKNKTNARVGGFNQAAGYGDYQPKPERVPKIPRMKREGHNEELVADLQEVLAIQSKSYAESQMIAYICGKIKELQQLQPDANIKFSVSDGNIYLTKGLVGAGEYYPCFVSHTDTVHEIHGAITDRLNIIETGGHFIAINDNLVQCGTGGDDKVGIWVCLSMMKNLPKVKCAFFMAEEVGCIGSGKAVVNFFKNCGYVLQCDRQKYGDFITNISGAISSDEFYQTCKPVLDGYSYEPEIGMMTDVMALSDLGIGISTANMSCGYYRPHSDDEVVNINQALAVLHMCWQLTKTLGNKRYPFARPVRKKYNPTNWDTGYERIDWGAPDFNDKYDWDKHKGRYVNKVKTPVCRCGKTNENDLISLPDGSVACWQCHVEVKPSDRICTICECDGIYPIEDTAYYYCITCDQAIKFTDTCTVQEFIDRK